MRPNLVQSATNYAVLVEQLSKQAMQISNQVQQIAQYETQLKRMGDMANVKSLVGFSEFRADLALPTKIKTWADGMTRVDGSGPVWRHPWRSVSWGLRPEFRGFDGETIERDATVYKEAHDMAVTVDEFKTVQSDVYKRREDLKRAHRSHERGATSYGNRG